MALTARSAYLITISSVLSCFWSCRKDSFEKLGNAALAGDVRSYSTHDIPYLPRNNADSVDLGEEISIKPDALKIGIESVQSVVVTDSSGLQIAGTTTNTGTEVRFKPRYELQPNMRYSVIASFTLRNFQDDTRQVSQVETTGRTISHSLQYDLAWTFHTRDDYRYSMRLASSSVTSFNRDGNKLMQMGDYIYSYGGWTAEPNATYNDVYRSSGDLSLWQKVQDAPWRGRHTFGLGKIDSTLYVFGGDYFMPSFDVWKSRDGENFTQVRQDVSSLLGRRILYGACVHKSKLYVVGGQDGIFENQGRSDVWCSTNGSFWRQVAKDLPFVAQNNSGAVASFAGRLWLIGGGYYHNDPSKRSFLNSIYSSADGAQWRREADAPWVGRQFSDVVVWNRRLWVIGGANPYNLNDIWYMTENGEWNQMEVPAEYRSRHATGVGVYNDQLVIVCGNYHNDCWVISKE